MTPFAGQPKKRVVCIWTRLVCITLNTSQCYFFDSEIGGFHYGPGHPWDVFDKVTSCQSDCRSLEWSPQGYGCVTHWWWITVCTKRWRYLYAHPCYASKSHSHYHLQRAKPATKREMTQFHSDEYVDFLNKITPNNMNQFVKEQHKCWSISHSGMLDNTHWQHRRTDNVGDDCPVFDGLFEYCSISAGGSMGQLRE